MYSEEDSPKIVEVVDKELDKELDFDLDIKDRLADLYLKL